MHSAGRGGQGAGAGVRRAPGGGPPAAALHTRSRAGPGRRSSGCPAVTGPALGGPGTRVHGPRPSCGAGPWEEPGPPSDSNGLPGPARPGPVTATGRGAALTARAGPRGGFVPCVPSPRAPWGCSLRARAHGGAPWQVEGHDPSNSPVSKNNALRPTV